MGTCQEFYESRNSRLKPRSAFVIMPFSSTKSASSEEWLETYELIFEAAFRSAGYDCERAHPETGSLVKTIIQKIQQAHIVLADVTDHNPNVFYELGVRHALSKRTIIVSQSEEFIPSDLKGYWAIVYKRTPKGVKTFIDDLGRIIALIETEPERSDNPVSDYLEQQNFGVINAAKADNARKLIALYTELTGNGLALDRAEEGGQFDRIFIGCLTLLLETLYVDPGPQVLAVAYELRQELASIKAGSGDRHLRQTARNKISVLERAINEIREKMLEGSYKEPSSVSVMVWTRSSDEGEHAHNEAGTTGRGAVFCTVSSIANYEAELEKADRILNAYPTHSRSICVIPTNEGLVGRANFKINSDDTHNLSYLFSG